MKFEDYLRFLVSLPGTNPFEEVFRDLYVTPSVIHASHFSIFNHFFRFFFNPNPPKIILLPVETGALASSGHAQVSQRVAKRRLLLCKFVFNMVH